MLIFIFYIIIFRKKKNFCYKALTNSVSVQAIIIKAPVKHNFYNVYDILFPNIGSLKISLFYPLSVILLTSLMQNYIVYILHNRDPFSV